jgi:hypothetical protein
MTQHTYTLAQAVRQPTYDRAAMVAGFLALCIAFTVALVTTWLTTGGW